ncbi:hypothetical protein [Hydrogenophaga crocea]|uniref:Uncharacterized protein n=1 Tax=Hydrogenophaga crocea TaxID=2716225 RepID=A0A6G8II40_9BURK|nr:hypothetical protein [Hydrogenophaga crocea]QIM52728.1 hypothetical protein G9Q37_11510 [Hydrogenophaga crocea]
MKKLVLKAVLVASTLLAAPSWAGLKEDVAAKEFEVSKLRAEVEPLARSIIVVSNDLRVFASLSPFVDAVKTINDRLQDKRTIRVQSTARNGKFWEDGPTWCNSYVELDNPDSFRANAVLSKVSADVRDDGAITLGSRAEIDGRVQLKFQFKGARYQQTIGICPVCVRTNVCPPGGGVGTSIGVGFQKNFDLQLLMAFARSADGRSVDYKAGFVSPKDISITAQIGLQGIGTIGHPMSFDLPQDPIASGSFPLLVTNEGEFKLPGGAGERTYTFVLTPTEFVANKNGITATWKSTVQFKP